jgi:phosphatidylglycerol lysyltransferase
MDALVWEISKILKKENYAEFSLGEVPFIANDKKHIFSKTNLLQFIGSKFKFAYNYEGLFHFKNKFATRWDNVFICSNGKLRFLDLFRIAKKSNLLSLTLYKMFN